jgi:hypothetical protein
MSYSVSNRWISIWGGILLPFFLISVAWAQESGSRFSFDYSGYIKELGQLAVGSDFDPVRYDNILHHRLETDWDFTSELSMQVDVRNRLLAGYTIKNQPGYADLLADDPGYVDLSWVWLESDQALMHTQIDRLQASWIRGNWEVHAGRQRLNWSRTFVWSPNDLFNNYAYLNFDYEERPGTDAIRAQYNWSYASGLELAYQPGDTYAQTVLAAMWKGNTGSYDLQSFAAWYHNRWALGGAISGYLGDASLKSELSLFEADPQRFDRNVTITATLGLDYMFANSLYLRSELLYNGGHSQTQSPTAQLLHPPAADNLFISKTAGFLDASYPVHPLVNASFSTMVSFDQSLFIFIPSISVSVTENLDFLFLSQVLQGEMLTDATDTPTFLYARLTWSY